MWAGFSGNIVDGLNGGLANGDIQGVASNRGLMVGYVYGESIATGANEIIQKSLLQGISEPRIDSPRAKAFLGAMGLLGPAGSGAQIWKDLGVTLGSEGASSQPQQINNVVEVYMDGQQLDARIVSRIDDFAEGLSNEVAGARG